MNLFTVTKNCEFVSLDAIESHLINLSATEGGTPRLYFSGEFDSIQSKFEKGSNNLKFGVLANNETVALVLLRFLRIIIDDRGDMLMKDSFCSLVSEECDPKEGNWVTCYMKRIVKNGESMKMDEIINRISSHEISYMNSFSLNEPISTSFIRKELNFEKRLDEIDIWTLPRVMFEMRDIEYEEFF